MLNTYLTERKAEFRKLWPSGFFTERKSTFDEIKAGKPFTQLISVEEFNDQTIVGVLERVAQRVKKQDNPYDIDSSSTFYKGYEEALKDLLALLQSSLAEMKKKE